MISSRHFNAEEKQTVKLSTDQVAVSLQLNATLQIACVTTCAIVVLYAFGLLLIDIVQLGRRNDALIRRLEGVVKAGRISVEYFCKYAAERLEMNNAAWDEDCLKFGEDRHTVQDPEGRLLFGTKKEVVRFKRGRKYL
jgi:hypothetical protein